MLTGTKIFRRQNRYWAIGLDGIELGPFLREGLASSAVNAANLQWKQNKDKHND